MNPLPCLLKRDKPLLAVVACISYDFKEEIICVRPKCHAEPVYMAAILYDGKPYALPLCETHGSELAREMHEDSERDRRIRGRNTRSLARARRL